MTPSSLGAVMPQTTKRVLSRRHSTDDGRVVGDGRPAVRAVFGWPVIETAVNPPQLPGFFEPLQSLVDARTAGEVGEITGDAVEHAGT